MIQMTAIRAAAAAMPWRAVAVVVLVGAAFVAGWSVQGWRKGGEIERLRRGYAEERLAQEADKVGALGDVRREEQRRIIEQTEIAYEAKRKADKAGSAALAADAAARELRARVAALVNASRSPGDPAAAGAGTSAPDAIAVLADVLGRCEARERAVARFADAAHIAGLACERAYDALTNSQHTEPHR